MCIAFLAILRLLQLMQSAAREADTTHDVNRGQTTRAAAVAHCVRCTSSPDVIEGSDFVLLTQLRVHAQQRSEPVRGLCDRLFDVLVEADAAGWRD